MQRAELEGWLRLSLTPGLGPVAARRLLAAFGLPDATLFTQSQAALAQVLTTAQASAVRRRPEGLDALCERTAAWLAGDNRPIDEPALARRVISLADAAYPAALLQLTDPPLLLYTLGAPDFDLTQLTRALGIVGSRNPTPQGLIHARSFARALGEAQITVVSGFALGIDGAAHEGALEASGSAQRLATVALVGTGLDRVYPPQHRDLARRIARQGLIVSEFPLGTPPLPANFPKRNRLIAGLTQGTLVVEAALASGSLITARLAAEQGKEVFAIPGSIHAPQARGCHALIRQGAKLVESVQDILEELAPLQPAVVASADIATSAVDSSADGPLLDALGYDPVSLDALGARTGWATSALQVRLLTLELEGRVARLPGGLFQRIAQA